MSSPTTPGPPTVHQPGGAQCNGWKQCHLHGLPRRCESHHQKVNKAFLALAVVVALAALRLELNANLNMQTSLRKTYFLIENMAVSIPEVQLYQIFGCISYVDQFTGMAICCCNKLSRHVVKAFTAFCKCHTPYI